jgi:hypothetical protein
MNSKFLLLALVIFTLFLRSNSNEDCYKDTGLNGKYACGEGCTGTPSCGKKTCGNVDDMCYCFCGPTESSAKCKTSELGYKWNGGIKLANGSYALNGIKGDNRHYRC